MNVDPANVMNMELTTVILLFSAGVAGGIINAIAGGATLITFPAMLLAGLPPVVANASNAVAISPGHFMAAMADREKRPDFDRSLVIPLVATIAGSSIGAILLMLMPATAFMRPIPFLIGFATLLFAFSTRLQAWTNARSFHRSGTRALAMKSSILFVVAIYGGFFGAGLGVMLTAILSMFDSADIRRVKVLKNILATSVSCVAIIIFAAKGMVDWATTVFMLVGALIGGYVGGHLIRIFPARLVRQLVILSGLIMTVYYARKI